MLHTAPVTSCLGQAVLSRKLLSKQSPPVTLTHQQSCPRAGTDTVFMSFHPLPSLCSPPQPKYLLHFCKV